MMINQLDIDILLTFINTFKKFKIMAKKFKISRSFTYKAYLVKNINEGEKIKKFIYKSECHYYVEKFILDMINNANVNENEKTLKLNNGIDFNIDSDYFEIINVCTIEDNNRENYLIESINVKNNQINIKSPVDDNI